MTIVRVGVVPVGQDDRQAPAGCAALRELHGVPLLRRAVGMLVRSGLVSRVVVTCPSVLTMAVVDMTAALVSPPGGPVVEIDVVGTDAHGVAGRVSAGLRGSAVADIVVVHDPLHALANAALVDALVTALSAAHPDVAAAVPVRAVIDTLKRVGPDDAVEGTVDRDGFRMVYSPQAYRGDLLVAALSQADGETLSRVGADALPRLLQSVGGRLLSVPAPAEVFRIATADDLDLAEAMVHVAGHDDAPAAVVPRR